MSAALLTIRLATARPSGAIDIDDGLLLDRFFGARHEIFADDLSHEDAGILRAQLEKAHLLASQSHLSDRIKDNHAELGMSKDLK
jgi:hypothetical protein